MYPLFAGCVLRKPHAVIAVCLTMSRRASKRLIDGGCSKPKAKIECNEQSRAFVAATKTSEEDKVVMFRLYSV